MVLIPIKAQLKFCQAKLYTMEWHALIDLLESIKQGLKINASVKGQKVTNNNGESRETNKSKKKGKKCWQNNNNNSNSNNNNNNNNKCQKKGGQSGTKNCDICALLGNLPQIHTIQTIANLSRHLQKIVCC